MFIRIASLRNNLNYERSELLTFFKSLAMGFQKLSFRTAKA